MRKYLLILISVFVINLNGQLRADDIIHGFSASLNHSKSGLNDYSRDYGFGFSLNHIGFPQHKINLIASIEYNRTNQFYEFQSGGQYYHFEDVHYKLDFISIPIGIRLKLDRAQIFSIEFGGYVDFGVNGSSDGISYIEILDAEYHTVIEIERTNFANEIHPTDIIGLYSAFNIQIPFMDNWIFIKPEYKVGFNKLQSTLDSIHSNYYRINIGFRFK